jgi:hypothetical protein
MNREHEPHTVCQEISGELKDIASWLSDGELTPEEFQRTVAAFEARKLQRFGFTLSSAISEDGTVHFSLRFADTGELCASMDVDPATGELAIQHTSVHKL